jgi:hypothetical protein
LRDKPSKATSKACGAQDPEANALGDLGFVHFNSKVSRNREKAESS